MAREFKCECDARFPETICLVCVAAMTHYAPRTIQAKAEAGTIPSVPMSRRHRVFLRESILYWLKNQETGLAA